MHEVLTLIIPYTTQILELIGVIIIMLGAAEAIYHLVIGRFNLENVAIKLKLAKALELALEFKLAAEILKTVLIQTTEELLILSAIVILRVIMTFVIHWEIKNTEYEQAAKELRPGKNKEK